MSLNPTGIEWTHVFGEGTGYTWNPITGCTRGCDYCYARALVETRLKDVYPQGFAPTFWPDRLRDVTPKQKPRGIFVGSMGDMWDLAVPQEWRDQVWARVSDCRQHVFFSLTKQPMVSTRHDNLWHTALRNIWRGVTVTRREELRPWEWPWCPAFVSFEPLLGPVCLDAEGWCPDWAIIGADSRRAGVAHNTARELGLAFIQGWIPGSEKELRADTPAVIGWGAHCEVHELFEPEHVDAVKQQFPEAVTIAHPECKPEVIAKVDISGSTKKMVDVVKASDAKQFMLFTECSMGDNLAAENPDKEMIRMCSHQCPHMALITLEDTLEALQKLQYQIELPEAILRDARVPIDNMLAIS